MTNQLLAEAEALPDLDEYFGMSTTDICLAAAHWPEGSEDQLRAIAAIRARAPDRHHNNPPLKEALDEELAPFRTRLEQLTEQRAKSVIIDQESAAKVVDLTRMHKELHDQIDKARKLRTQPYRDARKLIDDTYNALEIQLALAIGGTTGRDGLVGMLTKWDDQERAKVEAERRRLAEEARQREAEADAARAAAEAKAREGQTNVAAELEAVRARDEADRLARRAEAIRHEPTRSQLGQTTRRREIKFVVEDLPKRLRAILRTGWRKRIEQTVDDITAHELRDLGVAVVERGIDMPGVRVWVEEGGVMSADKLLCIWHGNCQLSIADAAYLAGLIDGEGSIAVNRTRSAGPKGCRSGFAYRGSVSIAMTDLTLLEWAQTTTRVGAISPKRVNVSKHRPAWVWSVWSSEASALLRQVLPHLRLKRQQAENLIQFQNAMRRPGSKGLTAAEQIFREDCRRRSQELNRRGIAA